MGHSILGRMDDMGTRMDELEQSIASLLQHAGLDQNGFRNNSSFDTTTSISSQGKPNSLRVSSNEPQSSISSKASATSKLQSQNLAASATLSPKTSAQPPISAANESKLTQSLSHIVSPTEQNLTVTPARARVTIEI